MTKKAQNKTLSLKKPVSLLPEYQVFDTLPDLSAVKDHPHYQLFEMLSYMRPHESEHEKLWIERYLLPVVGHSDKIGNYHLQVPHPDGSQPRVLFSGHTDTVHRSSGFQRLEYDAERQILRASNSNCLGADDTTGVYIMLKMIEAKVPGYYIFHRGEERGGIGSGWLAQNTPEVLEHIDIALAFDRMGTSDVITHQSSGKCASDDCANQIAAELCAHSDGKIIMMPCDQGTYTDTAEYNHLVSECFNLSVGYERQHTANESQDMRFLDVLLQACLKMDWANLPASRSVSDTGYSWYSDRYGGAMATEDRILYAIANYPLLFARMIEDMEIFSAEDLEEEIQEMELSEKAFSSYNDDGFTLDEKQVSGYDWGLDWDDDSQGWVEPS
jgi:hypothetical protein